jgi:short-subunit dehydrogenase
MKLTHARVLLTGASGGIGTAMTHALQQQGAHVMGVSRTPRDGPTSAWICADLSQPEGIDTVAQAARQWEANVVIHAAGQPLFGALAATSPCQSAALLQANLWAPIALTQALLPHLLAQPVARVVFVGSALGRIGVPGYSVYGASKAGLHGFAEALRRELHHTSLRVQLLAPRATQTAFNDAAARRFAAATGSATDSPARVAQELLSLLESDAAERFIGWPEKGMARVNGVLGPWLDAGFAQHRKTLDATRLKGTLT